ncbi:type II toxin-antitoxin system RelE/ParE family toxin [Parasphingorhabdus sp.]|uniref:type II toxin-antitoxin system RelE/ParE family toxin n=1 Tax=Parasphingorhabdus sp. TaxID=2709688 RepID=UPI003C76578A
MQIRQTGTFSKWLGKPKDHEARARIIMRINRFALGNPGDVKPVGEGVSEARVNYGPGYRLHFAERRGELVILLCGDSKKSQQADIEKAKKLASEV